MSQAPASYGSTRLHQRLARTLGLAEAALGHHTDALPWLTQAVQHHPDDTPLRTTWLRTEAAVHGTTTALNHYTEYATHLRTRQGTNPPAPLQALHQELLHADSPQRTGITHHPDLIGRTTDLQRVRTLLTQHRVITLLGPGGVGKTSLAQHLATESTLPRVHVIELVGITAAKGVLNQLGSAVGVRGSTPKETQAALVQALSEVPTLLVIDNCEHLVDDVAQVVGQLTASCPTVTVLATSRVPLAISAEHTHLLASLSPADASALFTARAHAVRPDAILDPAVVDELAERLDRLPLALELAAAKIRHLSASDLLARLDHRFTVLQGGDRTVPERHQALSSLVEWSWNLLDDATRRAWTWLAVLPAGFSLEGAEHMLGREAAGAVATLVEHSIVTVHETPAGTRYRMLETLREYATEQRTNQMAEKPSDALDAADAWASHLALREEPRLHGNHQLEAVHLVGAEAPQPGGCLAPGHGATQHLGGGGDLRVPGQAVERAQRTPAVLAGSPGSE